MEIKKKNIIILGSCGNLGMYFTDYLLKNLDLDKYNIVATGRQKSFPYQFGKNLDYCQLDITEKKDLINYLKIMYMQ